MTPAPISAVSSGASGRLWWSMTSSTMTFSMNGVTALSAMPTIATPKAMATLPMWAPRNGTMSRLIQPPLPGGLGWIWRTGGAPAGDRAFIGRLLSSGGFQAALGGGLVEGLLELLDGGPDGGGVGAAVDDGLQAFGHEGLGVGQRPPAGGGDLHLHGPAV